jgi:hypothetical protein
VAETDTFAGGSGSGCYDQEGELVGLELGGAPDYVFTDGCSCALVVSESREQHLPAGNGVRALCDAGWPSPRLCGTPHICGDAICGPDEPTECASDCPSARCGDSVCEVSEYQSCDADCARHAGVPPTFMSDPELYLSRRANAEELERASGCSIVLPGRSGPAANVHVTAIALAACARLGKRRTRNGTFPRRRRWHPTCNARWSAGNAPKRRSQ